MQELTFIPKNLEQRAKDFASMQAKKLAEFEIFLKLLQVEFFQGLKGVKLADSTEQLFIDIMLNCRIEIHDFCVRFYQHKDLIFVYDWKYENLDCWIVFEVDHKMSDVARKQFKKDFVEKFFKFKP